MPSFDSWYEALYGPRRIGFAPIWVTDPYSIPSPDTEASRNKPTTASSSNSSDDGDNGDRYDVRRDVGHVERDTPYLTEPAYWGNAWEPSLSWRDVAKTYGKYLALGPLTGGLAATRAFMNPTKDPLWQKAAEQYLAEFSPGTTLDQLIGQINEIYKSDMNAKVNATDTIRGVMMGLHPDFAQPYADWTQAGGTPYGFAQEWSGLQAMANAFPDIGLNTMPSVEPTFGTPNNLSEAFMQSYGIFGPPSVGGWYDSVHGRNMAPGQALAEAAARTQKSQHQRTLSREWMEETLAKKTTKTFDEWKNERESNNNGGSRGSVGNRGSYGDAGKGGNIGSGLGKDHDTRGPR